MTEEDLDKLVASITPQRLRTLAWTASGAFWIRRRRAVPTLALIQALTAGMDLGEGLERDRQMTRLHEAVVATVQTMPDATLVGGT